MTIEVRPLGTDEGAWARIAATDARSFYGDPKPREPQNSGGVLEFDRSVLAYDGDRPVGCASIFSLNVSVPGGSLPTAGVTWVGVVPTHRRRGAMTELMRSLHRQVVERANEPLLALWASQTSLYRRFGYGVSAHSYQADLPHHLQLLGPDSNDLTIDDVDPSGDYERVNAIYERVRRDRPGMPAVNAAWHESGTADPAADRNGASALRTYIARDGDVDVAYARLRYKHDWSQGFGDGTISLNEMLCATPAGAAALYSQFLATDLMTKTRIWNFPLDDPLLAWLNDPKQLQLRRRDQLHLRLARVEALEQRRYATDVDVVIDVIDNFQPENSGRWHLRAGSDAATCERTSQAPDVRVDVSVLGATFLGTSRWGALALAGEVEELTTGTVGRLDAAFSWPTAAFCPLVF